MSTEANAVRGRMASRNSRDRCRDEPARKVSGHSIANMKSPISKLMICNTGIGLTAGSRVRVRKSQNILGQKKLSIAAAT